MFLDNAEGTPYMMFYDMVGGSPILYPIVVVGLFYLFIAIFYFVYKEIVTHGKICRSVLNKISGIFHKNKIEENNSHQTENSTNPDEK
ncbi:MAG: hypothetical protein IKC64_04590 [Clostridia bacterium]|nr:hypothetical protein [Clostridia bacterium]